MQKITKNSISVAADHRAIGQHLGLFFFDASSPGSAFFLDNGMRIVDKLKSVLKFHQPQMKLVSTPTLFDTRLWSQSGHWQNYKENIFILETDHPDQSEKSTFAIKPMNCPAHCLIFKRETRSYRDLPLRLQEFDALHRNEASGALSGLVRVKKFHQDDGHIFCTRSQIYDEIKSTLEVIHTLYKNVFKFKEYSLALSTRPTDHLGTVQDYEGAQEILSNVLKDSGRDFFIKEGDGAFYGPKIDIQVTDSIGRNHQLATIQLDFQLPERFDLEYVGTIL